MAAFRLLLVAFGVGVTFFAIRFIATGNRQYLVWSLRLLAAALISGVVFFGVLLVTRLA